MNIQKKWRMEKKKVRVREERSLVVDRGESGGNRGLKQEKKTIQEEKYQEKRK